VLIFVVLAGLPVSRASSKQQGHRSMSARAYLLPDLPPQPAATSLPAKALKNGRTKSGFTTIDVVELPNGFWEVTGDHGLFGGRFRSDEQALRFAVEEGRTYRGFVLQMKSRSRD
jgi:hypothetical protein